MYVTMENCNSVKDRFLIQFRWLGYLRRVSLAFADRQGAEIRTDDYLIQGGNRATDHSSQIRLAYVTDRDASALDVAHFNGEERTFSQYEIKSLRRSGCIDLEERVLQWAL